MSGRKHSQEFKLKAALAAIKEDKTIPELCHQFNLHSSLITKWKKQLKDHGSLVFQEACREPETLPRKVEIETLRAKVGELVMERDSLKNVFYYSSFLFFSRMQKSFLLQSCQLVST